jgi:hypothetical protein
LPRLDVNHKPIIIKLACNLAPPTEAFGTRSKYNWTNDIELVSQLFIAIATIDCGDTSPNSTSSSSPPTATPHLVQRASLSHFLRQTLMPGLSALQLFTSKEMDPQHHQNGSAGATSKYPYLPLPSSSSPVSSLSSMFAKHRSTFLSGGLAKRLVAALLVGLACVVGLSFLLPVRSTPLGSPIKSNRTLLAFLCNFRNEFWTLWRLSTYLRPLLFHYRRLFYTQNLGSCSTFIILSSFFPSIITTARRVAPMATIRDIS